MRRRWWTWFCLIVVALLVPSHRQADSADDFLFAGSLISITQTAITIRQADGILISALLPDVADLSGKALAASHLIGDDVEIDCQELNPAVYDTAADAMRQMRVVKIYDRGKPSAQVLAQTLHSRALKLRPGTNLLDRPQPPADERSAASLALAAVSSSGARGAGDVAAGDAGLAAARAAVTDYVSKMPNYIADEIANRSTAPFDPANPRPSTVPWRNLDQISSELSVIGDRESRTHILRNGQAWSRPWVGLPGTRWLGAFAGELHNTFALDCPTQFSLNSSTEINHDAVSVYAFTSPSDGCLGGYVAGYREYFASAVGRGYIRRRDNAIVRLEYQVNDFPPDFPIVSVANEINWGPVTVDGKSYWVPLSATEIMATQNGWNRVVLQFKNYRQFSASTRITY